MRMALPYGTGFQEADLEWGRCLGVLDVADTPPLPSTSAAFHAGMAKPIALRKPALEAFRSGERVVVVVSDSFRQTGMELVLPLLVEELNKVGIQDSDLSFLVSTGTHRGPTEAEAARILGAEIHAAFRDRLYVHDAYDTTQLVTLGHTRRGTPVTLNRRYIEVDRRIVTGTVVLHYFAGFGGGPKSILPGLASAEAIAHNHALNLDPRENRLDPSVRIGALDGNPVAEDLDEAARLCPPDLLINTVLNRRGAIAGLFVGEMEAAHRQACAFARRLYEVPIRERADLVIASAGSAKNYLQSHKALFNAFQAMKPGGRIVFLAHAPEGLGGNKLAEWLRLGDCPAIMAGLRSHAEINGQTALSTREKAGHAVMVTSLSAADTALLGARCAPSFDEALCMCRDAFSAGGIANPSYYVMPSASHTVPVTDAASCAV